MIDNNRDRSLDAQKVLAQAKEMGEKAALIAAHIRHREPMPFHRRQMADAEFMLAFAGDDEKFWKMVRRAFEYAEGTMKLTAKIAEDAKRIKRER